MKKILSFENLEGKILMSVIPHAVAIKPPAQEDPGPPAKPPGGQWVTKPTKFLPPIGIVGVVPVSMPGPSPTPIYFVPGTQ